MGKGRGPGGERGGGDRQSPIYIYICIYNHKWKTHRQQSGHLGRCSSNTCTEGGGGCKQRWGGGGGGGWHHFDMKR